MKILKNYYKPTPKRWRKLGDALLYGCGAIGASGIMAFDQLKEIYSPKELKLMIGALLIAGFVGKFLTNFFKDESLNDKATGQ